MSKSVDETPRVVWEWEDYALNQRVRVVARGYNGGQPYFDLVAERREGRDALGEGNWVCCEEALSTRLIAIACYNAAQAAAPHVWQEHDRLTSSDLEYLFAQAAKLSARQLGEVIRRAAARGQLTQSDLVRLLEEAKAE